MAGCGGSQPLTVEQHQEAAAKESAAARDALHRHDTAAGTGEGGKAVPMSPGAFSPTGEWTYPEKVYDPGAYHLDEAETRSAHAAAHKKAAEELEHFEDAECQKLPPHTRASCPMLGPALGMAEIKNGVRVDFQPGVPVAAVIAHMRCHLAYAHAHGYSPDCPLYMNGVKIDATPDGKGAVITTDKSGDVAELRRRAKLQIVFGKPPQTL